MDLKSRIDRIGNTLVDAFQLAALFVIGGTIVWSAAHEYLEMMQAGRARLDEILLLFIYLEVGAMVGIYFKTDRLPVLFLLYVAITSLTRYLAVDSKELAVGTIVTVTGAILVLTLAALVLQVAASRFAMPDVPAIDTVKEVKRQAGSSKTAPPEPRKVGVSISPTTQEQ